jgi:hypothetical protein
MAMSPNIAESSRLMVARGFETIGSEGRSVSGEAKTPEEQAKESLERQTTIAIAVLATILAAVSLAAGNAGSDSLLAATRATDSWSHFQAKSVKEHNFEIQRDFAAILLPGAVDDAKRAAFVERCNKETARYAGEKQEIKTKAETYDKEAVDANVRNSTYGTGALLLQVGVVISSVSLLVHRRSLLNVGLLLGLAGTTIAVLTVAGYAHLVART